MKLSIVIPVYNERQNIEPLAKELFAVLDPKDEVIFIDDCSTDGSYEALKEIARKRPNVVVAGFRRNYGKSAALMEGFSRAKGSIVITMDADLQDDPKEIPKFVAKLNEGFDLVSGWKFSRQDPFTRRFPSRVFNWLTRALTHIPLHDANCGFKAYTKEAAKAVKIQGELHRYIPSLLAWQGFTMAEIKINHRRRLHGTSKFGTDRLVRGFLDLLTVKFLTTYGRRPLHFFGPIWLVMFVVGGAISAILAYDRLVLGQAIGGRPLLLLGVLLLVLGVQFFSLGFIGELISRATEEKRELK